MDGMTRVPAPRNEPVLTYAPGTPERAALQARLTELQAEQVDLTSTIGGQLGQPGLQRRSLCRAGRVGEHRLVVRGGHAGDGVHGSNLSQERVARERRKKPTLAGRSASRRMK